MRSLETSFCIIAFWAVCCHVASAWWFIGGKVQAKRNQGMKPIDLSFTSRSREIGCIALIYVMPVY